MCSSGEGIIHVAGSSYTSALHSDQGDVEASARETGLLTAMLKLSFGKVIRQISDERVGLSTHNSFAIIDKW